jgi:hypothetical protein
MDAYSLPIWLVGGENHSQMSNLSSYLAVEKFVKNSDSGNVENFSLRSTLQYKCERN